jgi:hypothetical protein
VGPTRAAAAAVHNRLHARCAWGTWGELGCRASWPKGGGALRAGSLRRRPTTRRGRGEAGRGGGGGEGRLGRGELAGPRQGASLGEKGGSFYFLFSYNLLLSAYFMETKQLHTREIDAWLGMMQQPSKIFPVFTYTRCRANSR